jgi:hypothetical protein
VLGAVFAVAAAVLVGWLALAPRATPYSGLNSWIVFALLAFILVLGGASVLFAASLPPAPGGSPPPSAGAASGPPPVPQAFPDGSFPEPGPADARAEYPSGSPAEFPTESPAGSTPPAGDDGSQDPASAGRRLTIIGTLIGVGGLVLATIAVALAALLPAPTQSIRVQFTDLYGRVQLEYCPTLPASFAATASHDDLAGSATILPVRVSAETCGNTDYGNGVWIYLNRASITVSSLP